MLERYSHIRMNGKRQAVETLSLKSKEGSPNSAMASPLNTPTQVAAARGGKSVRLIQSSNVAGRAKT
jgi:hypothetical protein